MLLTGCYMSRRTRIGFLRPVPELFSGALGPAMDYRSLQCCSVSTSHNRPPPHSFQLRSIMKWSVPIGYLEDMFKRKPHLDNVNQNDLVIIFQIHGMLRTNDIGDSLDYRISIELFVTTHSRSDGILYAKPLRSAHSKPDAAFPHGM